MGNSKKILVIDDDATFGELTKRCLEQSGDFEVIIALDGRSGLDVAKSFLPDLIILDILMSGRDGYATLERLKKDPLTLAIPVIMMTGVDSDEARVKSAGLYSEDYLTKPVDIEALRNKIFDVLRRQGVD